VTPAETDRNIAHLQQTVETYQRWKRESRRLYLVTPESLALFGQSCDRVIAQCTARIAELRR